MAGPLSPRCVRSNFSRKLGGEAAGRLRDFGIASGEGTVEAMTSAERPVSSHQRAWSSGREHKGNERGAWLDDLQAELASDVIAETGGAHLWDGEATRGDDEGLGDDRAGGGFDAGSRSSCG